MLYPVVSEMSETEIENITERLQEYTRYAQEYEHVFVSLNRYVCNVCLCD